MTRRDSGLHSPDLSPDLIQTLSPRGELPSKTGSPDKRTAPYKGAAEVRSGSKLGKPEETAE
jgi:hypothetical protein